MFDNQNLQEIADWLRVHGWRIAGIGFLTVLGIVVALVGSRKLGTLLSRNEEDPARGKRVRFWAAMAGYLAALLCLAGGVLLISNQFTPTQLGQSLQGFLGNWLVRKVINVTVIGVLMVVGFRGAGKASAKLFQVFFKHHPDAEIKKRAQTLSSIIRYLLIFLILGLGTMMLLKEVGVEIGPILAGAGIVGLAVGFGAQSLVQDFISGFFILLEDQIRVGDVVEIKGKGGLVEEMNLRMIILRDFSGNVHYIRNGQVDVVTNMTKTFSNYVFDVRVAYDQDVDEVVAILKELDEEMRRDPYFGSLILKPMEVFPIDQFAESAVIVKARTTTRPIRQWEVGREFNRRLKKRFDERGIRIPLPVRTIHIVQDGSTVEEKRQAIQGRENSD